ncbi:TetR family transcriptional regulator [Ktedonobacter sp. SOSP1-52]|uniref:TetR/AcrR family transcriptional regulator n=1 Tax=Ktedonobacter sp. SOSP1-52 TaxID=2778366 RepID=UPI0019154234|nr:TetR/AcrR family transcriptional regulator [Ktedonobacter sp. SOSP1-52]GHO64350.1 TetR family transcriptional regulator [Ktedonobacter sp. SOSP1-52]
MPGEEKRQRLIEAATQVMYQQGTHRTTLADVAQASGVPLGNVYYYFKTKDALVEAVIKAHLQEIRANLHALEALPDPWQRLKALACIGRSSRDQLMSYGCPYATLCLELEKEETPLAQSSSELFALQVDWAEKQFRQLDFGDEARDLAVDLLANMQGIYLLFQSLRSLEMFERKLTRLEKWLDDLAASHQAALP